MGKCGQKIDEMPPMLLLSHFQFLSPHKLLGAKGHGKGIVGESI